MIKKKEILTELRELKRWLGWVLYSDGSGSADWEPRNLINNVRDIRGELHDGERLEYLRTNFRLLNSRMDKLDACFSEDGEVVTFPIREVVRAICDFLKIEIIEIKPGVTAIKKTTGS